MLNNLKKELVAKKITTKSFAEFLGICEKSATNKLNGKTEFTYSEFKKICNFLFPEYNSDYLFADSKDEIA